MAINKESISFRKALILGGGGITGWMFEIGALTALDEFLENFSVKDFDLFIGVSAGSAVAALLANNVRPAHIFNAILRNKKVVYNFKREDIYSFAFQEFLASLKKFFRSFVPLMTHYYKNRKQLSLMELFYLFQENLPAGIFTTNNLENFLARNLNQKGSTNSFQNLKKRLFIPALDLDTGKYTVFGDEDNLDVPISKAVAASSAIPVLFLPVKIKGRDYIDGTVGRAAHLNIAVAQGADLTLVINPTTPINNDRREVCLFSFGNKKCGGLKDKGISHIADQVLRINTEIKMYLSLQRYRAEYPDKDFLLIEPSRSQMAMFNYNLMSFSGKCEILNCGYLTAVREIFKNYEVLKGIFAKHKIKVSLEKFKRRERRI